MANINALQDEIRKLKKEKKALVLAHYYVPEDVQSAADHVCDSFEMAKRASEASESIIVICGVYFMGESTKILAPGKKVLLPAPDAGCPMADMISPEQIMEYKRLHPRAAVVCYVNSPASVKAVSDVCCTSSSAEKVVRSLSEDEIIFVPDQHLGSYVAGKCPDKKFIIHKGFCPTHHRITESDVLAAKSAHPGAVFAAHPECREEVIRHADYVGSTSGILNFARKTEAKEILIGTELEITGRLSRELPDKKIYSVASAFVCPNMKKITLESLRDSLMYERYEVSLSDSEIKAAKSSLSRMINI